MNHQYCIDKDQHCVFIQFQGVISFSEMRDIMSEIVVSPDHVVGFNFLRDLSSATLQIENDLNSIKEVMQARENHVIDKLGKDRKTAWVLNNTRDFAIIHRMTTLARLEHGKITRQPFRDTATAREWLGIPVDYEIKYPDTI